MVIDAEKALREAHKTCPCTGVLDDNFGICEFGCRCCKAEPHYQYPDGVECLWPGHSAIDFAVRVVFEAGVLHGGEIRNSRETAPPLPSWLPADKETT